MPECSALENTVIAAVAAGTCCILNVLFVRQMLKLTDRDWATLASNSNVCRLDRIKDTAASFNSGLSGCELNRASGLGSLVEFEAVLRSMQGLPEHYSPN